MILNKVKADGKKTSPEDDDDTTSGRFGSDDALLGVSPFITNKLITPEDKEKKITALPQLSHMKQYKSAGFALKGIHQILNIIITHLWVFSFMVKMWATSLGGVMNIQASNTV